MISVCICTSEGRTAAVHDSASLCALSLSFYFIKGCEIAYAFEAGWLLLLIEPYPRWQEAKRNRVDANPSWQQNQSPQFPFFAETNASVRTSPPTPTS